MADDNFGAPVTRKATEIVAQLSLVSRLERRMFEPTRGARRWPNLPSTSWRTASGLAGADAAADAALDALDEGARGRRTPQEPRAAARAEHGSRRQRCGRYRRSLRGEGRRRRLHCRRSRYFRSRSHAGRRDPPPGLVEVREALPLGP